MDERDLAALDLNSLFQQTSSIDQGGALYYDDVNGVWLYEGRMLRVLLARRWEVCRCCCTAAVIWLKCPSVAFMRGVLLLVWLGCDSVATLGRIEGFSSVYFLLLVRRSRLFGCAR